MITAWHRASRSPRSAACRCASTTRSASPRPSRNTSSGSRPSRHEIRDRPRFLAGSGLHRRKSWSVPVFGLRMNVPVIAIDGPSASGKGTIAKKVAAAIVFHYLESGALYRLVALLAFREGLKEERAISEAAQRMDLVFRDDEIILEDQDVSAHIRHEEIGKRASEVARMPLVRQALLKRQRAFRQPPGLVADGRDMGTVVFPDAVLKIFLTASSQVRAERRYKQLKEKGIAANLGALSRDLAERDARDANRAVAPLVPAPDSQVLDSSALSIEAVVDRILKSWQQMGGRR